MGYCLENKKEWSIDTCYTVDESRKRHAKWKKPVTKDHILCDSICMKCSEQVNPQQNISQSNLSIYKKDCISWKKDIYLRKAKVINIWRLTTVIHCINRLRKTIFASIDGEKSSEKIQHPFIIKTSAN